MLIVIQIIISMLIIILNYNRKRLISSTTIWIVCYEAVFVIAPLLNSDVKYTNKSSIDVMSTTGIILYFIGMMIVKHAKIRKKIRTGAVYYTTLANSKVFKYAGVVYVLALCISISLLAHSIGFNGILSVLNGSITKKQLIIEGRLSSSNLFIYTMHFMIPSLLIVWMSASTKFEKYQRLIYLSTYVFFNVLFSFTRLWMMCTIVIIVLYECRNLKESKKFKYLTVAIAIFMLAMSSLSLLRGNGLGNLDWKEVLKIERIIQGTDFSYSYYYFDELLKYSPLYINPIVYLKFAYAFIPRAIWPNKPLVMSMQILKVIDPDTAMRGASSAGNSLLGEGYAVLGYLGVFLYPFIWGIICEWFDKLFYERRSWSNAICLADVYYYIFTVFIVISAQRGDWSQYMLFFVWFMMVPGYIIVKTANKRTI